MVAAARRDVLTSAISDWRHGLGLARLGSRCPAGSLSHRLPAARLAWLSHGVRLVGHRDEEWLQRGLTSSR
jgi:hypothetical protein